MLATHHGNIEKVDRAIQRHRLPLEYFRPMTKVPVIGEDGIAWHLVPLLFDYLFLRPLRNVDPDEIAMLLPIYWVCFGGQIALVSDEVVRETDELAARLSEQARIESSNQDFARLYEGRTVAIVSGPNGGTQGTVVSAGPDDTVFVEVQFFGRPIRCGVRVTNLKVIDGRSRFAE